jgi:hypothetical protein
MFLAFIAVFAGFLLAGTVGQAAPVNLLYFPLTNAPGNTFMPSSTSLGGVSVNLSTFNAAGGAVDFGGAVGLGVNGLVTGARAMCTTNGNGGTQPGNETGNYSGASAGNSAADNGVTGDAALGFGAIHDFVVTMWFNQPYKAPSGTGFVLPRLFVLSTGAGAGLNDGSANSIGVKFQQENQFIFSIGAATLTTTYASDFTTNKWYFVAWVYDNTNIYQYTGSDTAAATLQNQFASPGLTVTLANPSTLLVANRNYKGGRAFNGWMEDFRFYTNVASSGNNGAFVESIRQSIAPKIPTISGIYPDGTSLMQATNKLVFTAISPSGFNLTNISLVLNNVPIPTSSLLFVTNGTGSTNVTVSYASLPLQSINLAVMTASDAIGLVGSASVTFDTFDPNNFIVKADEFDFNSGQFIDNPVYTNVLDVAGVTNTYFGLDSVEGVDTHKGQSTGDNSATDYRYDDTTGLRTQTPLATTELSSPTRFGSGIVPDHMIGNWSSAEWQNYTKTFPAGNYNVYARLTTSSGSTVTFDQVTAGQGGPRSGQTLANLGTFTYTGNGAFQWVLLRKFGSPAVVSLPGQNTVSAITGGGANADFYMLVPADPSLPTISNVHPDGQFLFEPTNTLIFTVSSPAGINTANITLTLNGTNDSAGLAFSGGPNTWNVSYLGLLTNQTYATVISVTDSNAASVSAILTIDTWNPVMQVEAEDFDFNPAKSIVAGTGARYIDNPVATAPLVAAANSYEGQVGDTFIDEQGNNLNNGLSPLQNAYQGATLSNYRTNDPCATAPVTDSARRQFQASGVLDYNVGFLGPGHWEQYTRTWPSGTYNVYARVASGANLGTLYSSWSQVIAGWGTSNQITKHVGSFAIPSTGGYSSYFYTPLLDRFGNYAQLTLGGTNTFRDTHLVFNQTETANGAVYGLNINFYMLLAPNTDLPRIDNVYPDGSVLMQQTNTLSFVASSATAGMASTGIGVTLNGTNITAQLSIIGSSPSFNVSYPGLQPNTVYTAVINVTDLVNHVHSTTVNFDTFSTNNFTWEAENFDFDPTLSPISNGSGLRYIDNPVLTSITNANSYVEQTGDGGQTLITTFVTLPVIDYSAEFKDVLPVPTVYRTNDTIPLEVTGDTPRQKILNAKLQQLNPNIQDYDILTLTNGGWINYTRTLPTGQYLLYARLSAGATLTNFQCAQVVSGAGTTLQVSNVLGYFKATGNAYASWQYAQLINTNTGSPVILTNLGGAETLQMTGDWNEHVNFFMLVPYTQTITAPSITATISGGNVILSFPTVTGFTYTIQYKNNLTDPTWTQLVGGGNPVVGNNSTQSVTDSLSQTQRFYRLSIQ